MILKPTFGNQRKLFTTHQCLTATLITCSITLFTSGYAFAADVLIPQKFYSQLVLEKVKSLLNDESLEDVCPATKQPGYTCTGIMISAFENLSSPLIWTRPYNTEEDNKLSFSYWTKPILENNTRRGSYGSSGIMFWPAGELKTDGSAYMEDYTCGWPHDGGTSETLGTYQCGQKVTPRCQDLNIYTADDYLEAVNGNKDQGCGFALTMPKYDAQQAFSTILDLEERNINAIGRSYPYDEFLLKPWAGTEISKIPLMAFFVNYITEGNDFKNTLIQTQQEQLAFYQRAGVFAPIIVFTGDNWKSPHLSADPSYQSPEIPTRVQVFEGLKSSLTPEANK